MSTKVQHFLRRCYYESNNVRICRFWLLLSILSFFLIFWPALQLLLRPVHPVCNCFRVISTDMSRSGQFGECDITSHVVHVRIDRFFQYQRKVYHHSFKKWFIPFRFREEPQTGIHLLNLYSSKFMRLSFLELSKKVILWLSSGHLMWFFLGSSFTDE